MIRAFGLAFAQLFDRRILGLVALSLLVTLAVYMGLLAGVVWVLSHVQLAAIPTLDTMARWGSGLGAVLIAAVLFPGTVTAVIALGQDRVIAIVEARHYPSGPIPRSIGLAESLVASLRLLGLTIVINLLLLPLYLALLFLPPSNALLFAAANGVLLGREYFEAVALRHMSRAETSALRQRHRGKVWFAGVLTALLLLIPIVNLIAPVLATAAFVHLVQGLLQTESAQGRRA